LHGGTAAWWLNIGVVGAIAAAIPAIKYMADDTGYGNPFSSSFFSLFSPSFFIAC